MMNNPYIDVHGDDPSTWIRIFSVNADSEELVWHRDKKDRVIEVISGKGWSFQRDNEIPFPINSGSKFKIKAMVYHRLILGTTALKIQIKET